MQVLLDAYDILTSVIVNVETLTVGAAGVDSTKFVRRNTELPTFHIKAVTSECTATLRYNLRVNDTDEWVNVGTSVVVAAGSTERIGADFGADEYSLELESSGAGTTTVTAWATIWKK